MYPVFSSKSVLAIYQTLYCNGRYERCARFVLASQGTMPEPNLLPDGDRLKSG